MGLLLVVISSEARNFLFTPIRNRLGAIKAMERYRDHQHLLQRLRERVKRIDLEGSV
jgi:hypothetical protein